jgi:hypothetical protein
MVDFAKWTRAASAFLRRLTRLPGRVNVCDEIEPPANDDYHHEWLASDKCSLPPEIKRFLSTASRRCRFHYEWSPPPDHRHPLSTLSPNQQTLTGGGDFCEAAKYSNYDNASRRSGILGPSMLAAQRKFGLAAASIHMEIERNEGRLPLMELPNGDTILLQLAMSKGARPVVYVRSDATAEPQVLSPTFERFLLDWQRLSYLQPSAEYLAPWIDPASGQLNPDTKQADALSTLLLTGHNLLK